jgi:hypothetical protein
MLCDVKLIDTSSAIARRVLDVAFGMGHENQGDSYITIESTDKIEKKIISSLLQFSFELHYINISNK